MVNLTFLDAMISFEITGATFPATDRKAGTTQKGLGPGTNQHAKQDLNDSLTVTKQQLQTCNGFAAWPQPTTTPRQHSHHGPMPSSGPSSTDCC